MAEQVRKAGLEVRFADVGEPLPLRPDVAVAAYRITQEALTNVVKHAGAARVDVRLDWRDDSLMISITDDGRGGRPRAGAHGLIGVHERAAACGGTASAGPRPDRSGFQVLVRLPA